jgi:hypothetical protein
VTIAVVLATLVSYAWSVPARDVERISLPSTFGPTCYRQSGGSNGAAADDNGADDDATGACFDADDDNGADDGALRRRAWLTLGALSGEGAARLWAIAAASAVPITFFFYMDQVSAARS